VQSTRFLSSSGFRQLYSFAGVEAKFVSNKMPCKFA